MGYNTFHDTLDQDQAEQEALSLPEFPELRSVWQHNNGNHYIVEEISNRETVRQDKYPTTVIYRNVKNGNLYSRRLVDWHRSMMLTDMPLPTVDQIDAEIRAKFTEDYFTNNKEPSDRAIETLCADMALIARGAALRAYNDGLKQNAELRQGDGCPQKQAELSGDEIDTIMALRNGSAKVIPVADHEIAMRLKLKAEAMVDFLNDEAPNPLVEYLERQWKWSLETFGPGFRTAGILSHIRKELGEVEKEPFDLMEWVDIIILALDGFWRHGGSAIRLLPLLQFKQDKNFGRNWPRWQERSEDQAIEHDRSEEKAEASA